MRHSLSASLVLAFLLLAPADNGLAAEPDDWREAPGYRFKPLPPAPPRTAGLRRVPSTLTGVAFTNVLSDERMIRNRLLMSGSGVAAGDVDGDGWCDLYFCRLEGDNLLYRNLGNWKFEDVTGRANVACAAEDSLGAVFADLDADGDLDLLVSALGGGVRLFTNDGRGIFTDGTTNAGVASKTGSFSFALADIDGDADLDLYVANYRSTTIMDQPMTTFRVTLAGGRPIVSSVDGRPTTLPDLTNRFVVTPSGKVLELGEVDALLLNDGKGRFSAASFTDGTFLDENGMALREPPRDFGLAAQFHDLNGDRLPDLYVCNDLYTEDRVWMNIGSGKFRALPRLALRHTSTFSMGIDFADIDRDGDVDFFVTDMLSRSQQRRHVQVAEKGLIFSPIGVTDNRPQFLRNTLQLNRGDGTFADIAFYSGVEASEWSWGPIFLDIDLDGFEDLLIPNGQLGDFQNMDMAQRIEAIKAAKKLSADEIVNLVRLFPRLETTNLVFRNRRDLTFEEMAGAWGFADTDISQGMALADLDNDGDQDVVVNNLNGLAGLYRNEGAAPRVAVRLKGAAANTRGVGAKITVRGAAVDQTQEMICGGRYLSGDDPMRVFAAGPAERLEVEIAWRSGSNTVLPDLRPGFLYEIYETTTSSGSGTRSASTASPAKQTLRPLFEDASSMLAHRHTEEPFDDLQRQSLLPNRLSQLGPGVSWFDFDADGWDDLAIGTGRGGRVQLFQNQRGAAFVPFRAAFDQPAPRDTTTILGLKMPEANVLVGFANYEDGMQGDAMVRSFRGTNLAARVDVVSLTNWSAGPLAAADIDADGDLDLFVGARVIPGKYPASPPSLMLVNHQGKWSPLPSLPPLGLVSGAVFSDLTGDGLPELIVAVEWGPVRVLVNDGRRFTDATVRLGLASYRGWWNGIATGDFDGDGRLDIVASNWGLNHKFRATPAHPRRLYYHDLDGNGSTELIETVFDLEQQKEVFERDFRAIASIFPQLQERVRTFADYGRTSVQDAFGEQLRTWGLVEADTLASTVFLNRQHRFEARTLPPHAQFSPAFGICIADFDSDGHEDIFLSQNFFATGPETSRNDAGRGLVLAGLGDGNFKPLEGSSSGIAVYGEQRGCAAADFDGDGRTDLVVSQNGNETKLFRNRGSNAGLRVRLRGPAGNPQAIGARMRVHDGRRSGPVREVQAGGGYWSQNSAVQVLTRPAGASGRLIVDWPGGGATTNDIPSNATAIEISQR